jgi:hypothetical protein
MAMTLITANELHNRLVRAGHHSPPDEARICATDVWPPPETILTVAADLDPTLKPAGRQHYFACYLKSEEDPVPVLQEEPAFALPELFREVAKESPAGDCFLDGPFRWLLRRIARFDSVLLWPACREPGSGGAFTQAGLFEETPRLRGELPRDTASLAAIGAVILDIKREPDCRILWEVANQVSQSFFDYFVSDLECREVYRLHHHGKVVVSLPDGASRQGLLDELENWSDLIEDCSGYETDCDYEDE